MGHRDSLYQLSGIIELDDALISSRQKGKRGRGTNGKTNVMITCESGEKRTGFIAIEAVSSVCHLSLGEFREGKKCIQMPFQR
jgi:hypothetical protein